MATIQRPIWKDYECDLGTTDGIRYRVNVGSTIVFDGIGYKRPGATNVYVKVNDIVAPYLRSALPTVTDNYATANSQMSVQTKIYKIVSGTATLVDTVTFYANWTYDTAYDAMYGVSQPITGHAVPGQIVFISGIGAFYYNGTAIPASGAASGQRTLCKILASNFSYIGIGSAANKTYSKVNGCFRYALHYINELGGWDSLLIEGNGKMSDKVTRTTQSLYYNNSVASNRGEETILNEMERTWTLNTGMMTDAQSARMHHLLNSPNVYLQDLNESTVSQMMQPVILTNTECEYKTYKGNGAKMVQYEITCKLAQERIRR